MGSPREVFFVRLLSPSLSPSLSFSPTHINLHTPYYILSLTYTHSLWPYPGNHPVVRQPLRQWVLKITEYAEQLEQDLAGIQWPEGTLVAQKQWIGRSEGAKVTFPTEIREGARRNIYE
jgi:hypothetical protein